MNIDWNTILHHAEGCTHHLVAIVVASVVTLIVNSMVQRRQQALYGMQVAVRVCWIEGIEEPVLMEQAVETGTALDLTHDKSTAAALVRAARKCKNGLIDQRFCSSGMLQSILRQIEKTVSVRFAAGALGQAMGDKDITRGQYRLALFARGDEISVILADMGTRSRMRAEKPGSIWGEEGHGDQTVVEVTQFGSLDYEVERKCSVPCRLFM